MNLFDPQRPLLPVAERPKYLFNGYEVACIPRLDVEPEYDEVTGTIKFRVSCMLKVDSNSFVWHNCEVTDLNSFFSEWIADPEEVMRNRLHYKGPESKRKSLPDFERRAPKMFDKPQSQEATIVDFEDL